ncbi:MAG: sigma-70 family RNA polymerase sigma factor [Patescibacteria group bacterium]|jgi:RNA polymerase sigma factor (sigma-70 family)
MNNEINGFICGTYYVCNDHVLALLKILKESSTKDKEKVLASLVKQLGYLVQSKIKGYKHQLFYGDLLQEGKLGLLKAIKDFDPVRGINFFKFACWHIQHRIKLYLHWYKKINMVLKDEDNYFGTYEECSSDIFEQAEVKQTIINALNKLPEIDKRVLIMRFGINNNNFYTFKQIGDELFLSKQRIEQIQKRALLRLKNNTEIRLLVR